MAGEANGDRLRKPKRNRKQPAKLSEIGLNSVVVTLARNGVLFPVLKRIIAPATCRNWECYERAVQVVSVLKPANSIPYEAILHGLEPLPAIRSRGTVLVKVLELGHPEFLRLRA